MRLDTFLLADAATAPPDGKLYVHGGGLTVIRAPVVPLSIPLAVVIRIRVDDAELRSAHELVLSITGPDGNPVWPTQRLGFGPVDQIDPLAEGEERYIQVALSFGAIGFPTVGVYRFVLEGDGELLREMSVPVVEITLPQAPPPNRAARRRQARGG